jgi:hypothetical protein
MKLLRKITPALFIVVALSLLASLPLLKNAGLPNGSDVLYQVYRVGEMGRSWEHGMPFPRWAEGLYYGYGSPLWHFYASLTYYIATMFSRYLLLTSVDALRLVVVFSFLGMGVSMFAFMRRQLNELAGVLAAAAYVFSPYVLFTEPYARGTYPELLAFAIFPLVMWRFSALLRLPNGVNIAFASVCLYFLAISHNLMAIVLGALLIGWLLWAGVATALANRESWRLALRPYAFALLSVAFGLGLASYFWIPLILESHTVNLQNLTGVALLNYNNFFVRLDQLIQPMPLNDLGAITGLRNVTILGVAQWVGAWGGLITVLALVGMAIRQKRHDDALLRQGVYFALASVVLIFFVLPASSFLWDNLRPLQYLQFPWRLLGPVAFCLAFLVGMNALWLTRLPKIVQTLLSGAMLCVIVAFGIPGLTVPEWTNITVDTSIGAYHASEVAGLQRGTTFTDEYRPRNVFTLPDAVPALLDDYADGYPINKAHVADNVQATPIENSPIWLEWRVIAPQDFQMEVYTFYWEGWRAEVDNVLVEITPSPEHGFITFPVTAGNHDVRVYLATTPARILGGILSAIALITMLGVVAIRINNDEAFVYQTPLRPKDDETFFSLWSRQNPTVYTPLFGMSMGAIVAIGLAIANPIDVFWRNSAPSTSPATYVVQYNLDNGTSVIGYDINKTTFQRGDTVEISVYWYPRETATVNYSSFVHIGIFGTPPLAQADKLHPADRVMTEWWQPTGYLYDSYSIRLPNDLPSGEYEIMVGMYTCELMPADNCGNGYRPSVNDAEGNLLGDVVRLLTIKVE